MKLSDIGKPKGATTRRKLVGRGIGSGHGKTSTRGYKGQGARSGGIKRPGFEGGQMPLVMRIPKRGFTSKFRNTFQIVNVDSLNNFSSNTVVTPELLKERDLIKDTKKPVKVLGDGELKNKLTVKAHSFSKSAIEKIGKLGGTTELITHNS